MDIQLQSKSYGLECVTRSASQMDRFYQLLPFFSNYYEAAKIFFNAHGRWIQTYNILSYSKWYCNIDLRWHDSLNQEERIKIKNIFYNLGINNEHDIFKKLNEWIYFNRYVCLYFKDFIPDELLPKFENINFLGSGLDGVGNYNEYALESVIKCVIGKLKKPYFSYEEPMILFVSLATFVECVSLPQMKTFIQYLHEHFCSKLNEAIGKSSDKNHLNKSLGNLYAILIDTNSYNWIPNIAKKRYGAVFTKEIPNTYGVIYNTNIANHLAHYSDERIFNSIVPFCIELPLGIKERVMEEN